MGMFRLLLTEKNAIFKCGRFRPLPTNTETIQHKWTVPTTTHKHGDNSRNVRDPDHYPRTLTHFNKRGRFTPLLRNTDTIQQTWEFRLLSTNTDIIQHMWEVQFNIYIYIYIYGSLDYYSHTRTQFNNRGRLKPLLTKTETISRKTCEIPTTTHRHGHNSTNV